MGGWMQSLASMSSKDSTPATGVRLNWHRVSFIVALNLGAGMSPRCFATSLLDEDVGYYGSALLYVSTCLVSLFVSCPVVMTLGQRRGLSVGMFLYSVYDGLFALATALPRGSVGQWVVFLPASCLGGLAASLIWTAQGGYFGRSVAALAEATEMVRQNASAEQGSIFAVYFLIFEGCFKLMSAYALSKHLPPVLIFAACLLIGVATSLGAFTFADLGGNSAAGVSRPSTREKLLNAVRLWSDPVLWCLAPTNLTFGFTAAFLHGYVNANFTKPQLGSEYAGYFAAAVAFLAAVLSQGMGFASVCAGKGCFVLLGSACFLAIAGILLMADLSNWGLWLVVPYALQGVGRAVYESTNRGVWADLFPGAKSEGAFANLMVQTTLSVALTFLFSAKLPRSVLAAMIFSLAGAALPGYLLAHHLRRRKEQLPSYSMEADEAGDADAGPDKVPKAACEAAAAEV